jgi:hypothetical protein
MEENVRSMEPIGEANKDRRDGLPLLINKDGRWRPSAVGGDRCARWFHLNGKSLLDDRGEEQSFLSVSPCGSSFFVHLFLFGWSACYDLSLSSMETGWRLLPGSTIATIEQPPTTSAATIK